MKKSVVINGKEVGDNYSPYLIGEIGINHNGDLQIAKKLIDAAHATGWDCVKFQKRNPDICIPEDQKKKPKDTPWGKMTYLDYKKRLEFGKDEYDYIDKYCREKPICWSASPWDLDSLSFLSQYDLPFIKIASASITNDELLMSACKLNKLIVISTGMSTLDEIDHAVELVEKYSNGNYILLHANSTYPTPIKDLNLKMIKTLKERYNCLVGYSGHEIDIEPSIVAVMMGACMVERHITLNRDMWGTDQAASISPAGMYALKGRVDVLSEMMGNGVKILTEDEIAVRNKLRGN